MVSPIQNKMYNENNFQKIPQLSKFSQEDLHIIEVVSKVLPFKVNQYTIEKLINWNDIPNDPIYQLVFPQKGMLKEEHFNTISSLIKQGCNDFEVNHVVKQIRVQLNPHPSNQVQNIPQIENKRVEGIQHKYKETILFFPSQGQTCFTYCTFCFRWPQFIGDKELQFASKDSIALCNYLKLNKQVTDVILTGGDPMIMSAKLFEMYLQSLLDPGLEHIQTIRIGTKALTYWPHRFTLMADSDELLKIFEKVIKSGKKIALMAHFNHWIELEQELTVFAIKKLQDIGVMIRAQGPVLKHINDSADVWSKLWKKQVALNIVPYYMFVERDTGPSYYFEIPLVKAWDIYKNAIKTVSGLARTVRGPSMSTDFGKVEIQGVSEILGEKVFVLRYIQARNPDMVYTPFFAKYNPQAVWISDLEPIFNKENFFSKL